MYRIINPSLPVPDHIGLTMKYPDRYIITALVKDDHPTVNVAKGDRIYLYWSNEAGGWWQWSNAIGWAYRFETKSGSRFDDAMLVAAKVGPWYNYPDPATIEAINVPAIVKVY